MWGTKLKLLDLFPTDISGVVSVVKGKFTNLETVSLGDVKILHSKAFWKYYR